MAPIYIGIQFEFSLIFDMQKYTCFIIWRISYKSSST